jgi:hypothetical protein
MAFGRHTHAISPFFRMKPPLPAFHNVEKDWRCRPTVPRNHRTSAWLQRSGKHIQYDRSEDSFPQAVSVHDFRLGLDRLDRLYPYSYRAEDPIE